MAPPPPDVKPGVVPLRPIGVGEILDGAISTMRAYPRPMLGLSAIVVTVSQLLAFGALALLLGDFTAAISELDESSSTQDILDAVADALAATGIGAFLDWLAVIFLTGMLTVVVSKAVLGQQATASQAWQALRSRLGRLVLLSIVTSVLTALAFLLPMLPGGLAALAGAPGGIVALLLIPGFPAGVVLGVYVYVSLALATPALVLEKQAVRGAISRSRHLVRGSWWRVLGILLLAAVLTFVIASIIATPFQIAAGGGTAFFTNAGEGQDPSLAALFIGHIGQIIGYTITYPFGAAVTVLLYVDLRMRREGLDLELARAAGVNHPRGGPPDPGQHGYPHL